MTKTEAPTIPIHLSQRRQPEDHFPLVFGALFFGCLVCELTGNLLGLGPANQLGARRRLPQVCPGTEGATPKGRGDLRRVRPIVTQLQPISHTHGRARFATTRYIATIRLFDSPTCEYEVNGT